MSRNSALTNSILVVEDDTESRNVLAGFLQGEGYEVVAMADGLQALNKLRWQWRPACIILDMRMPLMTGWEFRKALDADPSLQGIPIIGVTAGRWKPADEKEFAALIAKPINYDELLEVLRRCCDSSDESDRAPRDSRSRKTN